jgi:RNA polymerase sigma-70 factor, ECF subfamily
MSDYHPEDWHDSAAESRVQEFVRLLTGNERRLKSYILTLVPNLADAEQIAQETSLRLWQQFGQYDPSLGDFSAWARSIAHYQVLTFRKKQGRERIVFSSELVDALAERAAVRESELAARQEALIDCVGKLPDHARELVRLYYYAGMKLRAAAERLGRSVAATEKAIVRIRRVLYNCVNSALRKDVQP